jgi:hypothetical protein
MTNYFLPQQKLVRKVRDGAKVTKTYDKPLTPHQRAGLHAKVSKQDKTIMKDTLEDLNPAAIQRHIQVLASHLSTLTTSKAAARHKPSVQTVASRASKDESTTKATRAS